jgi:hypothetical protein
MISNHLMPANLQGHTALTYARAPHCEADQSALLTCQLPPNPALLRSTKLILHLKHNARFSPLKISANIFACSSQPSPPTSCSRVLPYSSPSKRSIRPVCPPARGGREFVSHDDVSRQACNSQIVVTGQSKTNMIQGYHAQIQASHAIQNVTTNMSLARDTCCLNQSANVDISAKSTQVNQVIYSQSTDKSNCIRDSRFFLPTEGLLCQTQDLWCPSRMPVIQNCAQET